LYTIPPLPQHPDLSADYYTVDSEGDPERKSGKQRFLVV